MRSVKKTGGIWHPARKARLALHRAQREENNCKKPELMDSSTSYECREVCNPRRSAEGKHQRRFDPDTTSIHTASTRIPPFTIICQ